MKSIQQLQAEEAIASLRKKWIKAKEKEDTALMSLYERIAKKLKEINKL